MITVEEHLENILDQVQPVDTVTVAVTRAVGLVTAADVHGHADLPRFDNSSMDGYAVRRQDLEGADAENPVLLVVSGDVAAGDSLAREQVPGQAWRIMTGAPMPVGADAVVRVEDTDGHPREAQFRVQPEEGANIRRAGEDLHDGDVVIPEGTRIGPGQLAALVSAGVEQVEVVGHVRVAILSTGDELVAPGEPVGPGQIVDSNGPMLEALVREAGGQVVYVGHLRDDEKDTKKQIEHHVRSADLIITTGGVSKGEYDIVKKVLTGKGTMEFLEVAMQPGKPQGFGVLGKGVPVFTLPGNPVSVLVSFEAFVRPALERRSGRRTSVRRVRAYAAAPWKSSPDRETYTRVRISGDPSGGYAAIPSGGPGSHLVGGLAMADALAVSAADVTEVTAGTEVELFLLRPRPEIDGRLEEEAAKAEESAGAGGSDGSGDEGDG